MKQSREQELIQTVISKPWEDESFKAEFIENPASAIEALTGVVPKISEGKQLLVTDQSNQNIIHINIPVEQQLEDLELNEDQLEAVAGGKSLQAFLSKPVEQIIFDYPPLGDHPSGNNHGLTEYKS